MGGSSKINQSQNQLTSDATQQRNTSATLGTEGQQLIQTGQAEQQPLVDFLKSIIGGNSTSTAQAISPAIANITRSTNATKENIYDTTGPGVGRDVLLGENQRNQGAAVAGVTNDTFLKAFPELAALASGNTSAGLGLTGAGITSLSNAASTTGSVLNSQEQQKAQTLELVGSLAGTAGSIATGGIAGLGGKPCWIAEVVYGVDDRRTHLVRAWLTGPFCSTLFGRCVVTLYVIVGEKVAALVRKSVMLRSLFTALFNVALGKAEKWKVNA